MNRIVVVVALLGSGMAVPLGAASSCRDLKGLYTPCPPAIAGRAGRARTAAAEPAAAPVPAVRPRRPARPPAIAPARLCRDLKGLFTPCPR